VRETTMEQARSGDGLLSGIESFSGATTLNGKVTCRQSDRNRHCGAARWVVWGAGTVNLGGSRLPDYPLLITESIQA
jgi:hypothetical protein